MTKYKETKDMRENMYIMFIGKNIVYISMCFYNKCRVGLSIIPYELHQTNHIPIHHSYSFNWIKFREIFYFYAQLNGWKIYGNFVCNVYW